jgi:hypothetical protein
MQEKRKKIGMKEKRDRIPTNPKVRRALASMLSEKGYPPQYIAALIGWQDQVLDEEVMKMVMPLLEDEKFRKQQVVEWLRQMKDKLAGSRLVTLIEKEIEKFKR